MKPQLRSGLVSTGMAMFSMFFGAGNVVFPLAVGQIAGSQNFYAVCGLIFTAVGVPFIGLFSMILFDGNYHAFFGRLGKMQGFLLICLVMALIGPFVAIPRCIALSFATLKIYMPQLSLFIFNLIACVLLFLLTIHKESLLELLGKVLSPALLVSVVILIVCGLWNHPMPHVTHFAPLDMVLFGWKEGYNTLDLFAGFFFSSVVLISLKRELGSLEKGDYKMLARFTMKAAFIGGALLGIIYVGFSYIASYYAQQINVENPDELLGALAPHILGRTAGLLGNITVALACLTTAITLCAIFADFLSKEIFAGRHSYRLSLLLTLVITFTMANLGFKNLIRLMLPCWLIIYPALIVLSVCNIVYKLWGFRPIKIPFYLALATSLGYYFLSRGGA